MNPTIIFITYATCSYILELKKKLKIPKKYNNNKTDIIILSDGIICSKIKN